VQLDDLTQNSGEWLRGAGPESDIVISSRVRLARNLADFPFINRTTAQDRARIEKALHERIVEVYSAANIFEADSLCELLNEAGIQARVVGEDLGAAAGCLPLGESSRGSHSRARWTGWSRPEPR